MTESKAAPVHPGQVLLEEFLKPLELSRNRLGRNIGVPPGGSIRSCSANAG